MAQDSPVLVLCNGAALPKGRRSKSSRKEILEYRIGAQGQNLKISLPNFVRNVYHLEDRVLDLLEIASYVFGADRLEVRGHKDDLEYHAWPRSFHLIIKVRDYEFWNSPEVQRKLTKALVFMSGDSSYEFTFQPGHSTTATGLFDQKEFRLQTQRETRITLFSGGLDSLTGTLESLGTCGEDICLVSHQSQPGTIRTQTKLITKLSEDYPNRLSHYKFLCTLKGTRAEEETQRTRAFLYTSIAVALAQTLNQSNIFVYENGMTAVNWPKRQDQLNARASRTTHPQTIALLSDFFSTFCERPFSIETPYLWKTKTDVLETLASLNGQDLITSTVSCSKTFQKLGRDSTQCGECSQCVDRRFAAYAADLDDIDNAGIYANDFVSDRIEDGQAKTTVLDFVRQAKNFAQWSLDHFYTSSINELAEITDFLPGVDEPTATDGMCQ